jgi:5-methylcytosine-specific restriction endonuclease McrA
MSKHFFERLEPGYAGEKSPATMKWYERDNITCDLEFCSEQKTKYKGRGSNLCEHHQSLLREYGGPARQDRPWTFHKKKTCECCGHNPWKHPMVKKIKDKLVRDRVANGMLIVDHIHTQRDGGGHGPENVQTLCLDCNQIKSTLAGDTMPKKLYNDEQDYYDTLEKLKPYYDALFG